MGKKNIEGLECACTHMTYILQSMPDVICHGNICILHPAQDMNGLKPILPKRDNFHSRLKASTDKTISCRQLFFIDNYMWSTTKKHCLWGKLSTTKSENFQLSTTGSFCSETAHAVFVSKLLRVVDSKLLSTTLRLTAFCRL